MIGLSACSENETPKDIPFAMLPNGLKKSVETELIEKMKQEVIEGHQKQDRFSRTVKPILHFYDWGIELNIKRNSAEETLIFGQIYPDSMIGYWIQKYYLDNEKLSANQTIESIQNRNYESYSFSYYSHITKPKILEVIRRNKSELQRVPNQGNGYILLYTDLLEDWEQKLKTIETLNLEELKEIQPSARINVKDDLNFDGLSPLTTKALEGLIQVRDYASRKYFNLPYMDLYFQGTRNIHPDSEAKLAAIDFLHEVRITDESYARLNGLIIDWEWEEPEFTP